MSQVKSDSEIALMKKSGQICSAALKKVTQSAGPATTCYHLDQIAQKELKKRGATSSFVTVGNYQWTICTTVNDQVVHGIPKDTILKNGDILGIDIGALYKGYHSDMAITLGIGHVAKPVQKFLEVGQKTLRAAIEQARVGQRIGDISATIQQGIESAGYSIVKSLTGHGVGRKLHEEPMVPCFGKKDTGPVILENMVLAIEVIYAQGSGEVKLEKDGWTISTVDGSLGGLFEQTVAVTKNGPLVLTPYL